MDPDAATLGAAPGDPLPQLRPPLVTGDLGAFGRHRVLRLLGRGGMGAVYEAIDTALGRTVALKLMLPALAAAPTGRERFLREARAAAAVRHENVVNVYHVGEDEGTPFLTMELLRGDHLGHLIGGGLPVADVVRIGRDVARGLAAAHAIGVVHRDVKPANIWIEAPTGRVRLLDFGLARIGGEASIAVRSGPSAETGLTQAGELVGTPTYMSREQVEGEPVDFRTDLFSLGAVLYQMVTGRVPFEGRTLAGWADAIRSGVYTPVNEAVPTAPPALVRLIHALLAPRPEDRPRSADAVAAELLTIATQLLVRTDSAAAPVPVQHPEAPDSDPQFDFTEAPRPAPRRRGRPTQFLLGCAAALAGGLLLVGIVHRIHRAGRPAPEPVVKAPDPAAPVAPANSLPKGYVSIFNGRDLSGWKPPIEGRTDAWAVANGVLAGTPRANFQFHALLSERDYSDFELRLEYRWPAPGGHSVLLLRANEDKERYMKGLAISLADDEGYSAVHGHAVPDGYQSGLVLGLTFKPRAANKPLGEWNALRVVARRHVIEVELNGTKMPVANLDEKLELLKTHPEFARAQGPIGLLCFIGPIEYRNILVRPLP
ncbi:beta-jelly-roll-type glycoside hydrolase [Frigoriglobus tundricola]|uniref:Beta-jelly-roll-type glycoside hydrolase n=1 Tax=Frigoriglobus tundricola TaxID=2774151 RepID=A0A6M5YPT4_9BACT|nr:beta-jelly-roll-type glycoside hydrolase [Frigoriglobus tundricola]